ncbi:hypothetical protein J7297_02638 [Nakaseomyces glabratus]|nr:hypothetical protein J7296_04004 [Nakaseomyces glabratus]KAH7587364.1 hypothetical protein J7297_02638 [Nakaseomyces glabratus]
MRKNLAYDFTYCVSTLNIAGIASSDDLVLWTEDVKEIASWYPSLEDSLKIKQLLVLFQIDGNPFHILQKEYQPQV